MATRVSKHELKSKISSTRIIQLAKSQNQTQKIPPLVLLLAALELIHSRFQDPWDKALQQVGHQWLTRNRQGLKIDSLKTDLPQATSLIRPLPLMWVVEGNKNLEPLHSFLLRHLIKIHQTQSPQIVSLYTYRIIISKSKKDLRLFTSSSKTTNNQILVQILPIQGPLDPFKFKTVVIPNKFLLLALLELQQEAVMIS